MDLWRCDFALSHDGKDFETGKKNLDQMWIMFGVTHKSIDNFLIKTVNENKQTNGINDMNSLVEVIKIILLITVFQEFKNR